MQSQRYEEKKKEDNLREEKESELPSTKKSPGEPVCPQKEECLNFLFPNKDSCE